jgi:hypothetical protein
LSGIPWVTPPSNTIIFENIYIPFFLWAGFHFSAVFQFWSFSNMLRGGRGGGLKHASQIPVIFYLPFLLSCITSSLRESPKSISTAVCKDLFCYACI